MLTQSLINAACEAEEQFGLDELERYAAGKERPHDRRHVQWLRELGNLERQALHRQ
jgi:hypothetical protein